MKRVILKVSGMSGKTSEKKINNRVSLLGGIKKVKANSKLGEVDIVLAEDLNIKEVLEIIEDLEFKVIGLR